jgi:hypothetical protein
VLSFSSCPPCRRNVRAAGRDSNAPNIVELIIYLSFTARNERRAGRPDSFSLKTHQ